MYAQKLVLQMKIMIDGYVDLQTITLLFVGMALIKMNLLILNGQNPAGIIWSSVMNKIHLNLPSSKFKISSGVVSLNICEDSKLKSNSNCKNTYVEYFLKGTEPENCIIH